MNKLKIAILWHFHQPFYKLGEEFILPWVRLHGVKDYKDLPELFFEFPDIKQSINIVPSMWMQLSEYISGESFDRVQLLTLKNPTELTELESKELFRMFVLCNIENMIRPYPHYTYLYEKAKNSTIQDFTEQEITDLQVWYNLTWIGYFSRQSPAVARLFKQEKNFSIVDKQIVLDIHLEILSSIKTQLLRLRQLGQLEVSVSPLHHPILPLLCDTNSILESVPDSILPDTRFNFPEDAYFQVSKSLEYYRDIFGNSPEGMWPSEGSLSNEVLTILSNNNLKWAASDEMVLANSMHSDYKPEYKYFPIQYKSNTANITLFFRDHNLSDAIGFTYSNWNPKDAATNFVERLNSIRTQIINNCGENSLDYAVVPIILDGENCWEYYAENGVPFLRELFQSISNNELVETVLFKDVVGKYNPDIPVLDNIRAGSWINANFNIWAGHKDHRIAWSVLADTRRLIDSKKDVLTIETLKEVMELVYIAEGSDWFWWYGDSHWAENKYDFDILFRDYLARIYKLLGEPIPDVLLSPINQQTEQVSMKQAKNVLNFDNKTEIINSTVWQDAACYNANTAMSAMHQIGELIDYIYFGNSENELYLKLQLKDELQANQYIELVLTASTNRCKLIFLQNQFKYEGVALESIAYQSDANILFITIPNFIQDATKTVCIKIKTINNNSDILYPEINFIILP